MAQSAEQSRASCRKYRECNREKIRAATRAWTERNREKVRADARARWARNPNRTAVCLKAKLKKKYGLTLAEYAAMLESQRAVCAICGGTNPSEHRLSIDHDHATGRVRGLLCIRCNQAIGGLKDSPALCISAAGYLTRNAV